MTRIGKLSASLLSSWTPFSSPGAAAATYSLRIALSAEGRFSGVPRTFSTPLATRPTALGRSTIMSQSSKLSSRTVKSSSLGPGNRVLVRKQHNRVKFPGSLCIQTRETRRHFRDDNYFLFCHCSLIGYWV